MIKINTYETKQKVVDSSRRVVAHCGGGVFRVALGVEILWSSGTSGSHGVQNDRRTGGKGFGFCAAAQHERTLCAVCRLWHSLGNTAVVPLGFPSEGDRGEYLCDARSRSGQYGENASF